MDIISTRLELFAPASKLVGCRPEIEAGMMLRDYTPRQGQFLAFTYYYTKLNGQPSAELDEGCAQFIMKTP